MSLSATDCIAISRIGTGGDAGTGLGNEYIEVYADESRGIKIKGHTLFTQMSSSTDPIVADFVGGHAQFYYGTETNKLHKRSNQICEEIDKNKDDIKKLDTKVETYNDNTKKVLRSHETVLND